MSLDFIVVGLPRSGSTWVANWLNAGEVSCFHDPLWHTHYNDFQSLEINRVNGVCCTGLWRFPKWLNAQTCRKLVIERPLPHIRASLKQIGLSGILPADCAEQLAAIDGRRVSYEDLFDSAIARDIWEYLIGPSIPFNETRHQELCQIKVEPNLDTIRKDLELNRRLARELSQ